MARVEAKEAGLLKPGVRVLVVAGHPDDSEFYTGGTLLTIAATGAKIRLVAMTDGDKAYYPFGVDPGLRDARREEQRYAASLWRGDVVFLGFMDGRLPVNDETVSKLLDEVQRFDPDIVMAYDPVYRDRTSHSDHIDSGRNALLALEEWGKPCSAVLYNSRSANCFVDIEREWFGKMDLIKVHKSQFYGKRLDRITSYLADRAMREGTKAGQGMSEGFRAYRL